MLEGGASNLDGLVQESAEVGEDSSDSALQV